MQKLVAASASVLVAVGVWGVAPARYRSNGHCVTGAYQQQCTPSAPSSGGDSGVWRT